MKARLVFLGWFAGLFLRGFTSGLSPSLRGKDNNTLGYFDAVLEPIWQRRQRMLGSKGGGAKKGGKTSKKASNATSKKASDTGLVNFTGSKKSSKKGGVNNIFVTETGNNVNRTAYGFFPQTNGTTAPTNNSTNVKPPSNNTTTVTTPNNNTTEVKQPNNRTVVIPDNKTPAPTSLKSPGQGCNASSDCLNNACGFETLESKASGQKVCCPSGNTFMWSYPLGSALDNFCTQPVGAACFEEDELCISGICAGIVCVDGLQPDGKSCDTNSECSSRNCARGKAEGTSPLVCCPTGVGSEFMFVQFSVNYNTVCAGQPTGAPCLTDSGKKVDKLCSSGKCVNGVCT